MSLSDRRHRSIDHETWVPRCAGCLPVDVRPHRCQSMVRSFGFTNGYCYCDESACVDQKAEYFTAEQKRNLERRAEVHAQLAEHGYPPLVDYVKLLAGQDTLFD